MKVLNLFLILGLTFLTTMTPSCKKQKNRSPKVTKKKFKKIKTKTKKKPKPKKSRLILKKGRKHRSPGGFDKYDPDFQK